MSKSALKQLISPEIYKHISEKVIKPSLKGQSVTVITFKKAGFPFNLKHAIEVQLAEANIPANSVYIWLTLGSSLLPVDLINQVLLNLKRLHSANLAPHVQEILNNMLGKQQISQGEFLAFFDYLAEDEKLNIIFVVKSFESVFATDISSDLVHFIDNLYKHCKAYSNFIFLSNSDFQHLANQQTHTFWGDVQSNILWGADFMYDAASVKLSAQNFQQKYSIQFTPKFISCLAKYSQGDPAVVLYSFYQTLNDENFMAQLTSATNTADIYNILGAEFLDWRYNLIMEKMTQNEIKALISKDTSVRYIEKTGLLSNNGKTTSYLNPLFEQFVKTRLKSSARPKQKRDQITKPAELVGQELLAYNLLKSRPGEIVSKDQIAEAIWGSTWEQKYSDWALDKLISNLKKKLAVLDTPAKLQTFKKLGVMLVPIEQNLHSQSLPQQDLQ